MARRVDVAERVLAELLGDVLGRQLARPLGRRAGVALADEVAQLADPRVPGERQGTALHELRARIGLRVVRGGAHQPAVELPRADRPVEHLGADHPDVEHVGARVHDPARVLGGHPGSGQAHVAPEGDPLLLGGRALKLREHVRKGPPDAVRERLVHLVRIGAADVVGLEYGGVCHRGGFYRNPRLRK